MKKSERKPAKKGKKRTAKHAKKGKTEKGKVKKAEKKRPTEKGSKEKEKTKEKSKAEKKEKKTVDIAGRLKDYEILWHPLISEKAMNAIEAENKLTFIVSRKASKEEVKKAVEGLFEVKVDSVRVLKDMKGRKKAMVKINREFKAEDIATRLGVI